jgi:hypothetical protein
MWTDHGYDVPLALPVDFRKFTRAELVKKTALDLLS